MLTISSALRTSSASAGAEPVIWKTRIGSTTAVIVDPVIATTRAIQKSTNDLSCQIDSLSPSLDAIRIWLR